MNFFKQSIHLCRTWYGINIKEEFPNLQLTFYQMWEVEVSTELAFWLNDFSPNYSDICLSILQGSLVFLELFITYYIITQYHIWKQLMPSTNYLLDLNNNYVKSLLSNNMWGNVPNICFIFEKIKQKQEEKSGKLQLNYDKYILFPFMKRCLIIHVQYVLYTSELLDEL